MIKPTEPKVPGPDVELPKEPVVADFVYKYWPVAGFMSFSALTYILGGWAEIQGIGGTLEAFFVGFVIPAIVAFIVFKIFKLKFVKDCQALQSLPNFDQLLENSRRYRKADYYRRLDEAIQKYGVEKYEADWAAYKRAYAEYLEDLAKYEAEEKYRYEHGLESQEVENARLAREREAESRYVDREMRGIALAGLAALGAAHAKRDHDRRERQKAYDAEYDRKFNEMKERIYRESEEERKWNKRKAELLRELKH